LFQIDLPTANPEGAAEQINLNFDLDVSDICKVSAKTGVGVQKIFPKIIEAINWSPIATLLFLLILPNQADR